MKPSAATEVSSAGGSISARWFDGGGMATIELRCEMQGVEDKLIAAVTDDAGGKD